MSIPASPAEAEEIAMKAIGDYLTACRMAAGGNEAEMIANYLMKLVSVAGVVMAQAVGSDDAANRLVGTSEFLVSTMPRKPSRIERMQ